MPAHVRPQQTRASRRGGAAGFFFGCIGVLGEILITIAILLGLFAFWQVYWTSFEIRGEMEQKVSRFVVANKPASTEQGTDLTTDPPSFTKKLHEGEVYGVLHVPRWDWLKAPLTEGVSLDVINSGAAGHYPATVQPGEIGNFSVAGHRRTYGEIFQRIEEIAVGDKVVIELPDHYLTYSVTSWEIVDAYDPTNVRVIAPVPGDVSFTQQPKKRVMTMTTCHPDWGIAERYAVHLDFESWTPKSSGVPKALVGQPDVQAIAPEGQ